MQLSSIARRVRAAGTTIGFVWIALVFLFGAGPDTTDAQSLCEPQNAPEAGARILCAHPDPEPGCGSNPANPAVGQTIALPLVFVENPDAGTDGATHVVLGRDRSLRFAPHGLTVRFPSAGHRHDVTITFVDARPDVKAQGEDRQDGVVSWFSGPESSWKTGLATYQRLVYHELWPGIDLEFRAVQHRVKYAFHVRPGADPGRIRLRVTGADRVEANRAGDLCVESGPFSFVDPRPVAWQETGAARQDVDARYRLEARTDGRSWDVSVELGAYDQSRPLVVDPAVLVYGGYIGFNLYWAGGVAVDAQGRAYVAGVMAAYPPADAFVARVDATGTKLDYLAVVSGKGHDFGWAVAVDATNHAYLVGITDSDQSTFPVKVGPDLTYNGNDVFIAKLDPTGTNLVYCGYIGGAASYDAPRGVAVDAQGVAWVAGSTFSNDFPVVSGPGAQYSGNIDGFVTQVRADGTGLLSSGYLGGAFRDECLDVAVDRAGDAYVAGITYSTEVTFPVKVGPDLTFNGGTLGSPIDGFVAKIRAKDGALVYCGYIGGSGDDWANGVAVDAAGCAYAAGSTAAGPTPTFPVKVGPYLQRPTVTTATGFVAKVDPAGTSLIYCGFIPGGYGQDVDVDAQGRAFVGGDAQGALVVMNGPDPTFNGGIDAFVACVAANGQALEYSGYVGGALVERGTGVAVTPSGTAFLVGITTSDEQTFPVRTGPGLKYGGSGVDAEDPFVVSIVFTHLTLGGSTRIGQTATFHASASNSAGLPCQFATALGSGPTPIDSRQIGLDMDPLLIVSVVNLWPSVFVGYANQMDATGQAGASLNLPAIPALVGFRLHTAFVTLDAAAPSGVRAISNTVSFSVTP